MTKAEPKADAEAEYGGNHYSLPRISPVHYRGENREPKHAQPHRASNEEREHFPPHGYDWISR